MGDFIWFLKLSNSGSSETRIGRLVVLRIYVALAVFQPYRDLEAGDNQSLKFKSVEQGR